MSSAKLILGFTIATVLMVPGLGRAQTCNIDTECAKGLSCQVDTTVGTTTAICYAGDAGGVCVSPPVGASPKLCQLAPCVTVADCGQDMVCQSRTLTTCPTSPAAPAKCDPTTGCDAGAAPEPATCTDTTTSQCAYKWQLPCNADIDCGDGFTCQPTLMGMCSGSTGTATGSTGTASAGTGGASGSGGTPTPLPADVDAGVATPVTCWTVTSFPGSCQPKATSCTVNSDCPSVWTCAESNVGTAVSGGTATPGGPTTPGGSAPVAALDAGVSIAVPPPVATTVFTCQPPYGTYRGTTVDTTQGTSTALTSADAGTAKGSTTPPTPVAPSVNGGPSTGQTAATTAGGGCSLTAGDLSSDPAWLLGLLALVGLFIARRSRKG